MRSTSLMIRRGNSAIVPVDGAKYQHYQAPRVLAAKFPVWRG